MAFSDVNLTSIIELEIKQPNRCTFENYMHNVERHLIDFQDEHVDVAWPCVSILPLEQNIVCGE